MTGRLGFRSVGGVQHPTPTAILSAPSSPLGGAAARRIAPGDGGGHHGGRRRRAGSPPRRSGAAPPGRAWPTRGAARPLERLITAKPGGRAAFDLGIAVTRRSRSRHGLATMRVTSRKKAGELAIAGGHAIVDARASKVPPTCPGRSRIGAADGVAASRDSPPENPSAARSGNAGWPRTVARDRAERLAVLTMSNSSGAAGSWRTPSSREDRSADSRAGCRPE